MSGPERPPRAIPQANRIHAPEHKNTHKKDFRQALSPPDFQGNVQVLLLMRDGGVLGKAREGRLVDLGARTSTQQHSLEHRGKDTPHAGRFFTS